MKNCKSGINIIIILTKFIKVYERVTCVIFITCNVKIILINIILLIIIKSVKVYNLPIDVWK